MCGTPNNEEVKCQTEAFTFLISKWTRNIHAPTKSKKVGTNILRIIYIVWGLSKQIEGNTFEVGVSKSVLTQKEILEKQTLKLPLLSKGTNCTNNYFIQFYNKAESFHNSCSSMNIRQGLFENTQFNVKILRTRTSVFTWGKRSADVAADTIEFLTRLVFFKRSSSCWVLTEIIKLITQNTRHRIILWIHQ